MGDAQEFAFLQAKQSPAKQSQWTTDQFGEHICAHLALKKKAHLDGSLSHHVFRFHLYFLTDCFLKQYVISLVFNVVCSDLSAFLWILCYHLKLIYLFCWSV